MEHRVGEDIEGERQDRVEHSDHTNKHIELRREIIVSVYRRDLFSLSLKSVFGAHWVLIKFIVIFKPNNKINQLLKKQQRKHTKSRGFEG